MSIVLDPDKLAEPASLSFIIQSSRIRLDKEEPKVVKEGEPGDKESQSPAELIYKSDLILTDQAKEDLKTMGFGVKDQGSSLSGAEPLAQSQTIILTEGETDLNNTETTEAIGNTEISTEGQEGDPASELSPDPDLQGQAETEEIISEEIIEPTYGPGYESIDLSLTKEAEDKIIKILKESNANPMVEKNLIEKIDLGYEMREDEIQKLLIIQNLTYSEEPVKNKLGKEVKGQTKETLGIKLTFENPTTILDADMVAYIKEDYKAVLDDKDVSAQFKAIEKAQEEALAKEESESETELLTETVTEETEAKEETEKQKLETEVQGQSQEEALAEEPLDQEPRLSPAQEEAYEALAAMTVNDEPLVDAEKVEDGIGQENDLIAKAAESSPMMATFSLFSSAMMTKARGAGNQAQNFTLEGTIAIEGGAVQAGTTHVLRISEYLKLADGETPAPLKATIGGTEKEIATGVYDAANKTITYTYNTEVDNG